MKAQNHLGEMYREGEGVPKDAMEAVKWLQRAADQGYATAQLSLGIMYANGAGTRRDVIKAYLWIAVALSDQNLHDRLTLFGGQNYFELMLQEIKQQMTPAQLAQAERLSREWKSKQQ